jgi:AcrR family transcriptional regulator
MTKRDDPSATAARLSREALHRLVWSRPLGVVAAEFGITGNGLAKICDRLLIPHPPRGYWAGGGAKADPPALPAAPQGHVEGDIEISAQRAASRRPRTRMPAEARREEILATAARILKAEGLTGASIKRIAREAGVSEALAQRYFPTIMDLLVLLARRENAEMAASINQAMAPFETYVDRAQAAASGYLNYVAAHGGLLQILLGSGEVRAALRAEYRARREWSGRNMASNLSRDLKLDLSTAAMGTQILQAVTVRAGKLLAERRLALEPAQRLSAAMIQAGRARLVEG